MYTTGERMDPNNTIICDLIVFIISKYIYHDHWYVIWPKSNTPICMYYILFSTRTTTTILYIQLEVHLRKGEVHAFYKYMSNYWLNYINIYKNNNFICIYYI